MLAAFESQLYLVFEETKLVRANSSSTCILQTYEQVKFSQKYAFFSNWSCWLPLSMINSHNQACFIWENLLLIMTKSRHYFGLHRQTYIKKNKSITRLPFSSRATLGSLWTGRIRSSARLWRPHSGLAWFIWGKERGERK